jgi:hypothetical protein
MQSQSHVARLSFVINQQNTAPTNEDKCCQPPVTTPLFALIVWTNLIVEPDRDELRKDEPGERLSLSLPLKRKRAR